MRFLSLVRSGKNKARIRCAWRPEVVAVLEGRALMAAFGLDPAFNGGQALIAPTALTNPASTNSNDAVAVQSDGKIVVAGMGAAATDPTSGSLAISVRRYNTDGTLDPTFGTGGQAQVLVPSGSATAATVAPSLLILPSGQIVLDVNLSQTTASQSIPGGTVTTYFGSDVVALAANGALDTGFGTKGIASFTTDVPSFTNLVAQPDGKILLGGLASNPNATPANVRTAVLTRLDADGSVDSTFGGGSLLFLAGVKAANGTALSPIDTSGLGLTTAGKIKVVSDYQVPTGSDINGLYGVLQLNADGTTDTTYGTNGFTSTPDSTVSTLAAASVLPSGQVVLVASNAIPGEIGGSTRVSRLNADGTADAAFGTITFGLGAQSAVVGPDGSIVVAGGATASGLANLPIELARITAAGQVDTKFGPGGVVRINVPNAALGSSSLTISGVTINTPARVAADDLALTADGRIVVAGTASYSSIPFGSVPISVSYGSQSILAVARPVNPSAVSNDYDGDGKSDIAAELAQFGAFAYRTATGDTVQPFGPSGAGNAIPAPGDYDGDGRTDVAAYLPAYGVLAYRPSSGGADVLVRFGPTGVGNAIPVPGDYDGDGKTDVALYLPGSGTFAIDPSSGAAPYAVTFGAAGAGNSIPAPGDYDGDGRTDLAVYLPASGAFAIDPSSGAAPYAVPFGSPGAGNTLPAPGDYDGDGKTDVAAYLPQYGIYAYRTSTGFGDVLTSFGPAGVGNAIPVPGDYDGDGKADIALYLPSSATFAIDPSAGKTLARVLGATTDSDAIAPSGSGVPYAVQFGAAGAGNTVPATAVVLSQDSTVSTMSLAASVPDTPADVPVYLPDDVLGTTAAKKKATT